jgi:hypothetical protein
MSGQNPVKVRKSRYRLISENPSWYRDQRFLYRAHEHHK